MFDLRLPLGLTGMFEGGGRQGETLMMTDNNKKRKQIGEGVNHLFQTIADFHRAFCVVFSSSITLVILVNITII